MAQLEREFGRIFLKFYVTIHPKGLSDEIPGKGSNLHWMGHRVAEWLVKDIPDAKDENIIVSAFDVAKPFPATTTFESEDGTSRTLRDASAISLKTGSLEN